MVSSAYAYDFSAIIDGLLARKKIQGPHANVILSTTRERGLNLLSLPDARYMPAFKILDMLAAMVAIAAAINNATQLRTNEVHALLRESFSDDTKLMRHFMLEAALERARYEPLMLEVKVTNPRAERSMILERRWQAMRTAHHEKVALPNAWMDIIDAAVNRALTAEIFLDFRSGPLLQMLAEMLALARKMQQQNESLASLEKALSPRGDLWRRYALKTIRYREPASVATDVAKLQAPHTIH